MQQSLAILNTLIQELSQQQRPVASIPSAPNLQQAFDSSLQESGHDLNDLIPILRDYLAINPDVSHADFYKLLYAGQNETALLGDWVTALSNANMHTYQMSPVATLMELELIQSLNQLIGFDNGDGIMVSGGSQANIIAMMLARQQAFPAGKKQGFQEKTFVAFVSDQAHYSMLKGANVLGLGSDHLIAVPSDNSGKIKPKALEAAIQQSLSIGQTPFFIGLTAGTTVIGAFDDVKACSEIAKRYQLWLHIDGAWGAPVLFSPQHKHLIADSELADSFTWDAHKLMNVPLTASFILVKQAGLLEETCSGGGGEYLFHKDENAAFNLGQRSIQCGRRADALKVWLSWKHLGSQGFAQKVDYLQHCKQQFIQRIEEHPDFELLAPAAYLNVLFRYVPKSNMTEAQSRELTIKLCKTLVSQGGAYVDYAQFAGKTGIRLILANSAVTLNDLDRLLEQYQQLGQCLSTEL